MSQADLSLLRTQPHFTDLYLSIYQPPVTFQAQVTGTVSHGDLVIPYYNPSGSYNDVKTGSTLYVGSTPGGKDKGSIYIFGIDGSTVTVGENSHINWQNGDYLTAVNFYQIWPIYPRYIQDEENVTVYKVYSIEYTNQNELLGALICMGPHHAGFLDDYGEHLLYYSASGTTHLAGDSVSYFWSFEGGNPTFSYDETPGYVSYTGTGHFTTRLFVSGSAGTIESGYRHISIYDRDVNKPVQSWGMDGFSGSRDEGGYTVRLWVDDDISNVVDGALVVIFADDWYGATKQSLGGNAENREKIVFVGYILDGSISYDYQNSRVSFDVGSPTSIMKIGEAFGVSVEDSTDPIAGAATKGGSPWFYLKGLTIESAIYHYTRWHSTINVCADVQYVGDDKCIQYFDADRTSLYDAIQTLMRDAVYGAMVSDRQGKLWLEIDHGAINNADSTLPQTMFVDRHDWIGQPVITERLANQVSYVEGGGVAYTGTVDSFQPLLSAAPGLTPAYRGNNVKLSGFALESQEQLNTMMGNIYAQLNARYPEVILTLAGNYRNVDIAPQEILQLTVAEEDTARGIVWTQKAFVPRSINWTYDPRNGSFIPQVFLAEVTQGFDADSIIIPLAPPDDGYDQPGVDVPEIPKPSPSPPASGGGGVGGGGYFAPALGGYDYDTGAPIEDFVGNGVNLCFDCWRSGQGTFVAPVAGTYGIYPILSATAAGTPNITHQVGHDACGIDTYTVHTNGASTALAKGVNCGVYQIDVTMAQGDALILQIVRNAPDSSGADIQLYGWMIVP